MPAVFILLRSLVIRLLSSRLVGSVAQYLRRILSTGATHLGTALRHIWDRVRSQESKEAILGCVLCILNMHKKVENWALSLPLSTFGSTLHLTAELRLDNCLVRRAHKGMKQTFFRAHLDLSNFVLFLFSYWDTSHVWEYCEEGAALYHWDKAVSSCCGKMSGFYRELSAWRDSG